MQAIVIGLVTFALCCLWIDQDIFETPRERLNGWLAAIGWRVLPGVTLSRAGVRARLARFAWKVLACPFCLGMYVAFFATWYVRGWVVGELWSAVFWVTWFAAWGAHVIATVFWKMAKQLIETAQLVSYDIERRTTMPPQPQQVSESEYDRGTDD